jgi:parallel beta-helix repeat protein
MSYTLRGRIESRLAALVPVVVTAGVLALAEHRWWPVEAVGLMAGIGLALDLQVYHRLLRYQPGWVALPLGALELAVLLAVMRAAEIGAPLGQAVALYCGGWLVAQTLGHAGFPLLRLGYAEEGGELGRLGLAAALAIGVVFAGAGATAYAQLPPVVHLATGVHEGPLVISRREVLVGEPGAVVRGGIVVAHDDVTIKNVAVVGGENGITIDDHDGTRLENVSVSGARYDGIHVRGGSITIRNCSIDMLGNQFGQGIDISFTMGAGMNMVDGCTVVGGMDGIVTHSSMTEIANNRVARTSMTGISMTEMSMGAIERNTIRNANGVGIFCNDRSMCEVERNTVVDTKADGTENRSRGGIGVLASFQSEADMRDNELAANPVPIGAVMNSVIRRAED